MNATEEQPAAHLGPRARTIAFAIFAALILVAVSRPITDPDLWQHLRVGRAIWDLRAIPSTNVWTWPTAGAPYDVPSWLFRVALWPFWAAFGERGLDLWRWLTTLALFGLLAAAARRASRGTGEGLITLALLVWSALFWRQRSQCRPETLAAILLAAEIWLLEARRTRIAAPRISRDPAWLLVPLMALWINLHISYYLGLVAGGGFLLDALWRNARGDPSGAPKALAAAMMLAAAACFLNPYGARAMLEPFQFFVNGRRELIFTVVDELQPIAWPANLHNALPLYLAALLAFAVTRWRRRGFDPAQAVLIAALLPQALATNRFLGFFVIATAPAFARDVEEALGAALARRQRRESTGPKGERREGAGRKGERRDGTGRKGERREGTGRKGTAWVRIALVFVPVAALEALDLSRDRVGPGFGVDWSRPPSGACEFIASHDIRGRGYNMFWQGGYLLWRFWPEEGRLPFMDIHQTGTRADRDAQVLSQKDPAAWRALDARYRFDWVMLPTHQGRSHHLLDQLDADTSRWALVFTDDAASLFVRRDGRCAALSDAGYRDLRVGNERFIALGRLALGDTALRLRLAQELSHAIAGTRWNSRLRSLRASVALADGRWRDARGDLEAALALDPGLEAGHARLAYALLRDGEPGRALAELARARAAGLAREVAEPLEREARSALQGGR